MNFKANLPKQNNSAGKYYAKTIFWMIYNTKSNTLSVQGGYMNEEGYIYPFDKSEVRSMLEEIFDEYN